MIIQNSIFLFLFRCRNLSLVSQERWEIFIKNIQEECPSISENDLFRLGGLLAKLEFSQSKFSLLKKLEELESYQLDELHNILEDWNFNTAKLVLDELRLRLNLLEELKIRIHDKNTDEVQELQPLFHSGLWIFGPEYETIEYTSNEGMTKVIQDLLGDKTLKGSRKRPDFAILPDSTVGLYSYPRFDEDGGEMGVEKLTIVELKRPGVPIDSEEKGQAWKYVKELYQKGLLKKYSKVMCFVLGDSIEPEETGERSEKDGNVRIRPLEYDIVIKRANSRLLKLYEKVKHAPFLQKTRMQKFLKPEGTKI